MHAAIRLSAAGLTLVLLASVAGAPAAAAAAARDAERSESAARPSWPSPPAAAKVRFVKQVAFASDWGAGSRGWRRIVDALAGRREGGFVRPTGVAVAAGVLIVADPGAQAIVVMDPTRGREVRIRRAGDRMLLSPVSVAPGPAGTLYVADSALGQVLQFDLRGELRQVFADAGLQRPTAVVYDPVRDRLYVADARAHQVHVFDSRGSHLQALGGLGTEPGRFNSPTHLALTRDGALVVTDALNHRVQLLNAEGEWLRTVGEIGDGAGNFAAPKGVAVDRNGHVHAADAMFDAVQIFDQSGRLLLGFGEQGAAAGQFWLPNGLFIDEADRLFVADAYNRRIQVFQLLAGSPAP